MNVRLKNSSAISPTGASIYNKVVENMATGKTRTGRQRMNMLAREYLT